MKKNEKKIYIKKKIDGRFFIYKDGEEKGKETRLCGVRGSRNNE